uniref:LisH domain-containing protein n=1 Tax=Macrostomum lignano TaxID=282301 RepID=A0A1I8IWX4_9PLAT
QRIRLGIRHLAPAESTAPSSAATPLAPAASSMASGRDCRPDQWLASLPERQLAPEQDLNRLLLDYLRHQGHLEAAEAFQREARGLPTPETAAVPHAELRCRIREAVQSGRIDEAAELLESARPGLLASRPGLEFRLRLQQLLELVRVGRPSEALDLAQQRLAPLAEARPERLSDLEEAMGLLAFERPAESAAFGHWLGQGQRRRLAGLLDAAIAGARPRGRCGGRWGWQRRCGARGSSEDKSGKDGAADFESRLAGRGVGVVAAGHLAELLRAGRLTWAELDGETFAAVSEIDFPEHALVSALKEFEEAADDLRPGEARTVALNCALKAWRESAMGHSASKGPSEASLKRLLQRTGFSHEVTAGQRRYGPPPGRQREPPRPPSCEVFISRLPPDAFEDSLVPLLEEEPGRCSTCKSPQNLPAALTRASPSPSLPAPPMPSAPPSAPLPSADCSVPTHLRLQSAFKSAGLNGLTGVGLLRPAAAAASSNVPSASSQSPASNPRLLFPGIRQPRPDDARRRKNGLVKDRGRCVFADCSGAAPATSVWTGRTPLKSCGDQQRQSKEARRCPSTTSCVPAHQEDRETLNPAPPAAHPQPKALPEAELRRRVASFGQLDSVTRNSRLADGAGPAARAAASLVRSPDAADALVASLMVCRRSRSPQVHVGVGHRLLVQHGDLLLHLLQSSGGRAGRQRGGRATRGGGGAAVGQADGDGGVTGVAAVKLVSLPHGGLVVDALDRHRDVLRLADVARSRGVQRAHEAAVDPAEGAGAEAIGGAHGNQQNPGNRVCGEAAGAPLDPHGDREAPPTRLEQRHGPHPHLVVALRHRLQQGAADQLLHGRRTAAAVGSPGQRLALRWLPHLVPVPAVQPLLKGDVCDGPHPHLVVALRHRLQQGAADQLLLGRRTAAAVGSPGQRLALRWLPHLVPVPAVQPLLKGDAVVLPAAVAVGLVLHIVVDHCAIRRVRLPPQQLEPDGAGTGSADSDLAGISSASGSARVRRMMRAGFEHRCRVVLYCGCWNSSRHATSCGGPRVSCGGAMASTMSSWHFSSGQFVFGAVVGATVATGAGVASAGSGSRGSSRAEGEARRDSVPTGNDSSEEALRRPNRKRRVALRCRIRMESDSGLRVGGRSSALARASSSCPWMVGQAAHCRLRKSGRCSHWQWRRQDRLELAGKLRPPPLLPLRPSGSSNCESPLLSSGSLAETSKSSGPRRFSSHHPPIRHQRRPPLQPNLVAGCRLAVELVRRRRLGRQRLYVDDAALAAVLLLPLQQYLRHHEESVAAGRPEILGREGTNQLLIRLSLVLTVPDALRAVLQMTGVGQRLGRRPLAGGVRLRLVQRIDVVAGREGRLPLPDLAGGRVRVLNGLVRADQAVVNGVAQHVALVADHQVRPMQDDPAGRDQPHHDVE